MDPFNQIYATVAQEYRISDFIFASGKNLFKTNQNKKAKNIMKLVINCLLVTVTLILVDAIQGQLLPPPTKFPPKFVGE